MSFKGKAFTPAFLPLFCDIRDFSGELGFIGAGLNLIRGVSCSVEVEPASCVKLNFLHGSRELNLPWIEEAVKRLLLKANVSGVRGTLDFNFEIPLNFDLSLPTAALVSSLASIYSALKLNVPALDVIKIARNIEFEYKIGFGTSFLQSIGGLVLVRGYSHGFPGDILKINYPKDIRVVVGSASSIEMLFYDHLWSNVNLEGILSNLSTLGDFKLIVKKTWLFTDVLASHHDDMNTIVDGLKRLNPIICGLSLNGKLVYAICWRDQIMRFADFLLDFFPCEGIMVLEVDPIGTRIYL